MPRESHQSRRCLLWPLLFCLAACGAPSSRPLHTLVLPPSTSHASPQKLLEDTYASRLPRTRAWHPKHSPVPPDERQADAASLSRLIHLAPVAGEGRLLSFESKQANHGWTVVTLVVSIERSDKGFGADATRARIVSYEHERYEDLTPTWESVLGRRRLWVLDTCPAGASWAYHLVTVADANALKGLSAWRPERPWTDRDTIDQWSLRGTECIEPEALAPLPPLDSWDHYNNVPPS